MEGLVDIEPSGSGGTVCDTSGYSRRIRALLRAQPLNELERREVFEVVGGGDLRHVQLLNITAAAKAVKV